MDGHAKMVLKYMGDVIFTDEKFFCQKVQRQFFVQMVFNVKDQVLIQEVFRFLIFGRVLFVYNAVLKKDQFIYIQGDLGHFAEAACIHFPNQAHGLGLESVKGDLVIVKNVFLSFFHV